MDTERRAQAHPTEDGDQKAVSPAAGPAGIDAAKQPENANQTAGEKTAASSKERYQTTERNLLSARHPAIVNRPHNFRRAPELGLRHRDAIERQPTVIGRFAFQSIAVR